MSKLEVDAIEPQSGTTLTIGASGDSVNIASGASFASTGIDDNATSTAITINSSEQVGIGTSSPNSFAKLHIVDSAGTLPTMASGDVVTIQNNNDVDYNAGFTAIGGSNGISYIQFGDDADKNAGAVYYYNSDDSMRFIANASERMRINSVGSLLVGATTAGASEKLRLYSPNTTNATFLFNFGNANGGVFQAENSGRLKTGTQSQSPYNYAVTGRDVYVSSGGLLGFLSSIRDSKTNIENISDVSWLYQLNPVSFNYKVQDEQGNYTEEAEADKFYGLIAEEVEPINSDICFYKNNNPEDGLAGVDYKKLYAPMIKALQELKTENEELKTRITALENA